METDRIGPLSYDLTAPEGDADAAKAIVVAVLAMAVILAVGLVGGWFVLGVVARASYVVVGVPVLLVVAPLLLAYRLLRHALRGTRTKSLAAVLAVSLFASFISYRALSSIKPALPQVRYSLDSLHVPAGYHLVAEQTRGDRFCRHGCPRIDRTYQAPVDDPDPVRTFILAMFAQGWQRTSDVPPEQATLAAKDGLTAQLAADGHVLRITVQRDS
jgi:hypothetical protein